MTITAQQRSLIVCALVFVVGFILSLTQKSAVPEAMERASVVSMNDAANRSAASTSSTLPVIFWPQLASSTGQVVRAVDGDTVDVLPDGESKVVRVRLLGINTPESVDPRRPVQCFGKEASKQMKTLVEGKRIVLVEDPQADDRDKYGRLLRNLVLENGTDVNATLVAQGFAHAYLSFPLDKDRKAQLRRLEAEAKTGEYGLWNEATCAGEAYK